MTIACNYDYDSQRKLSANAFGFLCLTYLCLLVLPSNVAAGDGKGFTDLFSTQAFQGSWEIFEKMNWVGMLLQWAISAFSLIGMAMVVFRFIITLLYLSNKNLFNTVADLKSQGKGQKFFGFGNMGKQVMNANYGVGLDAIIGFLLMLLPNIKEYSDYATDGSSKYNLQENDTMVMYVLKTALPTIMTIFIFAMGFNGVLWQAYANVADGMGVAAKAFVDERLDDIVTRTLNIGSGPNFTYAADDTEYGRFKQNLAKSIYSKVISKSKDVGTDFKLNLSTKIEAWVNANADSLACYALGCTMDNGKGDAVVIMNDINSHIETGASATADGTNAYKQSVQGNAKTAIESLSDQETGNLQYSVIVNTAPSYDASTNIVTIPTSELGLQSSSSAQGKDWYVHVRVSKKEKAVETNYFSVKEEKKEVNNNQGGNEQQAPSTTQLNKNPGADE